MTNKLSQESFIKTRLLQKTYVRQHYKRHQTGCKNTFPS